MSVAHDTGSGKILKSWVDDMITEILEISRFDNSFNIPLGGGSSKDGAVIYMDRSVPKTYTQRNGKEVPLWKFLVLHEWWEKRGMDAGLKYTPAHTGGTSVELTALQDEGYSIAEYDAQWDKWLKVAAKHKLGDGTPPDLETRPYEES